MVQVPNPPLAGARVLVVGVANEDSIAWGCARAFREMGAEIALTYLNDKALPYVEPLARQVEAPILMPLDVEDDAQMDALFAHRGRMGATRFVMHSVAFAPKADLQGGLLNSSAAGFARAMDVSPPSSAWRAARCR
jgi:enoyl-[acyl-carrier protein] reductase I